MSGTSRPTSTFSGAGESNGSQEGLDGEDASNVGFWERKFCINYQLSLLSQSYKPLFICGVETSCNNHPFSPTGHVGAAANWWVGRCGRNGEWAGLQMPQGHSGGQVRDPKYMKRTSRYFTAWGWILKLHQIQVSSSQSRFCSQHDGKGDWEDQHWWNWKQYGEITFSHRNADFNWKIWHYF